MSEHVGVATKTEASNDAHNIVHGVKLPPQPGILMALAKELQQPEASFKKVHDLLKKDIAISAKLLKLINSPLYNNGKKIDSIERALARLGLLNFYTIILGSCLKETFATNDVNSERLWEHTQVVAGITKHIAQISKACSGEHAYMAGLFHDAALPLILAKDKQFSHVIMMVTSQGGNIHHYESQNTTSKIHHAVIGNLLARSWGLPDDVCEAILLHHSSEFELFSNGNSRALGMSVILADAIARKCCEHSDATENADDPNVFTYICNELNLDDHDLEELYTHAHELAAMSHI